MRYHLYVESKKRAQMNFFYKTEVESQMQKTNLWLRGEKEGRDKSGDWD